MEELRDIRHDNKYVVLSQLKDAAEKASNEQDKAALTIIGGALSLGYNHSECNYRPLIQLSDGHRSYAMEDIDSGAIEILKEAVNVISPDWMRAQLSDIIWIQTSDHSYAECATREYISVFENVFDAENWVGCFEAIQHAYDISIRLGKKSTSFLQVRENLDETICLQFAYGFVKNAGQVSLDDLSFLTEKNAVIPSGRNEIIKFGLYLGLSGKLYAAMHILLPQMEHIIRNLVALCGDTVSFIKDGCEEYKPLSQLFKSDKLHECYDEDIIFTFQSIMDERAGANLRNINAHGLMGPSIGNGGATLCFLSLIIKFLSLYSVEANRIMKKLSSKRKEIETQEQ